jgi:hypothetical protein
MNAFPLLETEPLSPEAEHRIFTALAREMTLDAPAASVDGADFVEDATISYLQPDDPSAHRRRKPLLLALVAVAAAVLGVGIMIRDNSARTRTGTDVTPETMPIYLPTKLPDGFIFSNGSDFTSRDDLPFRDQIYRDLSKPIGARVVQITTSLASAWSDRNLGHPILIQGRPASDMSERDLFAIRMTDGPVSIRIAGRGVSYAEIELLAESAKAASTNPADGANVSVLPDGLKLVVDQGAIPPNRSINAIFSLADDGVHELVVNVWPASSMNLDQWTMGPRGAFTPTTVRGHDAISFGDAEQNMVGFVWPETTSVLVAVLGRSLSAEKVRQTAEGLRRVTSKKWANLLKSKDIPIQDDGAPGSLVTIGSPTTAATNTSDQPADPFTLPLLVPNDATDLGQLRGAKDKTAGATFDGSPRISRRQVYREAGSVPGSRALQAEWSQAKPTGASPLGAGIEGQALFTEAIPPGMLRTNTVDPNGLYFRLSGRGFAEDELKAIAKSITAPWTADRINITSLPVGFVEVESRVSSYEQYRSTTLDYRLVSVAMNPIGSGTIESYAIVTAGSFTATKVRGHDGYIVTDPATNALRLVWVESPGLLVEVKGAGKDAATLQRIAESLQSVSTDAWKKLLATVGAEPETVKTP